MAEKSFDQGKVHNSKERRMDKIRLIKYESDCECETNLSSATK